MPGMFGFMKSSEKPFALKCPGYLLLLFIAVSAANIQAAVVLQYHHVSTSTPASTSISPNLFEQHLSYLQEQEYKVWRLSRIVEQIKRGTPLPDKVVAITFDDAYSSIFSEALPLLESRGWPFTVFVSTGQIQETSGSLMSWTQLKQLQQRGAEMANHTHTHTHLVRRLPGESSKHWRARVSGELLKAARILKARLGTDLGLFAYPYGEYIEELQALVRNLDYTGFGQQSGALGPDSDLSALPRFPMTNQFGAMDAFKTKVAALPLSAVDISPHWHLIEGPDALADGVRLKFKIRNFRPEGFACFISGKGKVAIDVSAGKEMVSVSVPGPIDLKTGRSRLNCTVAANSPELEGRFYWFSHPWMYKEADGSWYQEP